jgi:hypothetical protein
MVSKYRELLYFITFFALKQSWCELYSSALFTNKLKIEISFIVVNMNRFIVFS